MIKRKQIQILEVISVLLFSLLANFVFDFKNLNFHYNWDYLGIVRLACLAVAAFFLNRSLIILRGIAQNVDQEFLSAINDQLTMLNKHILLPQTEKGKTEASNKIHIKSPEERFQEYLSNEKNEIKGKLIFSIILLILFFLIQPIAYSCFGIK